MLHECLNILQQRLLLGEPLLLWKSQERIDAPSMNLPEPDANLHLIEKIELHRPLHQANRVCLLREPFL